MKNGTVLKYHEPPEAKRAKGWRIYIFRDGKEIDDLNLDGQSSFLIGKDRNVPSRQKL
jgi:smad nuclear-interacting protein 1